jgi:hypothetical protein
MRKSVPMLLAFFLSCILLTGCAKKEEGVTPPSVTEGVITGKVEAGGKPLAGVEVSIPGLGISVETGSDGSFKLTGLMEGAWEVVFKKEGYVASPVTVTLSSGEKKDIGTISMTQTGSISGVVTIQGETSFGGVSVSIKELPEIPPVKTKEDGSFVIANVPPGSYTLVAEKVGYSPVQATIEVEEGKVFEIELVIKTKEIPEKANLVLYLKFDEGQGNVVKDSAGGPDLTIDGTPNWIPGKVGKALKFDGSQGITVSPSDKLNSIREQLTVAAWIRVDAPSSSANQGGIRRQGAWLLEVENPGEKGGVGFSSVLWIGGANVRADGEIPFELGKWHHVVAVYDGTELRLYVDGKLDQKTPASGLIDVPGNPLTIGRWETELIDGALDEIMIWNKALKEDQIKTLMAP